MRKLKLLILPLAICSLLTTLFPEFNSVNAAVLKAVPGYESVGLHLDYLLIKDGGSTLTSEVHFRELPNGAWQPAIDMTLVYMEKSARSVIVNLKENTSYEVKVAYTIDGKSDEKIISFTTKNPKVPIAKTIVLDESNFKDHLTITESGTADGYIRYTAKPGFVLQGIEANRETILMEGVEYVILDGLTVRGPSFNSIAVNGCNNVHITNCDIAHYGTTRIQTFEENPHPGYDNGVDISYQAGIAIHDVKDMLIERNYIHDSNGRANSWFYSHPGGPTAIFSGKAAATTVRFNDLIASDYHRWNDANEGWMNGGEYGSYYMDAEIYGNYFAFSNDDAIELDGGQGNSRFFRNKSEGGICGISTAPCTLGPTYVFENVVCHPGDEFGYALNAIKNNMAIYGKGRIYIFNNILMDFPCGISGFGKKELPDDLKKELKLVTRNNVSNTDRLFRFDVPFEYTVDLDYDWVRQGDATDFNDQEKNLIPGHPEFPNAGKGDFRPAVRPVGAVIPNFCPDEKVGTDYLIPYRPLPVETSVAQLNFMSNGAPQTFTIRATDSNFQGKFKIVQTAETEYLQITPMEGEIKNGQDIKVTVTIRPEKIKQARMSNTAILVRMENGLSRPISIYVDSRQDKKKIKNDRKEAIFGNVREEADHYSITFDVPKDEKYFIFVQASPMEAAPTIEVDGVKKENWIFYGGPGEGVKWCVLGYMLGLNQPEEVKAGKYTVKIRKDAKTNIQVKNAALAKTPEEMMFAVYTD